MSTADDSLIASRPGPRLIAALTRIAAAPRLYVYLSCTLAAVLVSYHLGKEMLWDTMDYHVYAGFSALHDRFDLDYFAAGPQGYFNPYAYVPFYLLLRSPLTPLEDASILAALQSAILWLTFELAVTAAPTRKPRARTALAVLATIFAFANPVLIIQLGSSYADITTAELALAGWVVTAGAIRDLDAKRIGWGAVLLGAATGLKVTNAVHAVAAVTLLAFIPGSWKDRVRHGAIFAVGVGGSFAAVSAPWSILLERNFGNPVFPLLNGVFRSPEYSTGSMVAYRFIPRSLAAALLRPFSMALPRQMVDVEWMAPDVRYAVLAVLALVALLFCARRWVRGSASTIAAPAPDPAADRMLLALGCGFAVDWTLWLIASGNGRYLIPMACVAAVLDVALIFRLFSGRLRVRTYLLLAVVGVQILQVCVGTEYRPWLSWHDGPWVNLSMPPRLASQDDLYFLMGEQTNSFIAPYLSRGSGFINLNGEYGLSPHGANGRRVRRLIARFNPHLRVLVAGTSVDAARNANLSDGSSAVNTLRTFGLKVDTQHCSNIIARGVSTLRLATAGADHGPQHRAATPPNTEHLVACRLLWNGAERAPPPVPGQRAADLAFDHLEEACPGLFQPARPLDKVTGDAAQGYVFSRRYADTEILAWIAHGRIRFQHFYRFDGSELSAGSEREWERAPLPVACGRAGHGFLRLLQSPAAESH
jgi:hypothetical protein